ncbi:bacteriocin secretion accessory protein [Xylocopilactobacillus apicola]|uniref:Bacteriocin ABC transporter permease n=1 Tax=Xylocopilactobacillus apicola TaxID=2932184 RepID=A0AAU9DA80_9LACO|nr:bacteriocin secretion accessory protein [Xylocopilactobacillus apicola]BDR57737.1 bacteriocin ABC transporter permease [Xylocopilactobacillus apicola]
MDKSVLESSEFYNKRFNNFSIMIIIPTAILLFLVIMFSLIGQREITIKSVVQINSGKTVPVVQSMSNNKILKNYLNEGNYVHAKDVLVTYQSTDVNQQLDLLKSQSNLIQEQLKDLDTLKKSILQNKNLFNEDSKFGYNDLFKSYANQRQVYSLENSLVSEQSSQESGKKAKIINNLNSNLQTYNDQINSYQSIFNAIKNGGKPDNSTYNYIYQNYLAKDKELTTDSDKSANKNEYLDNLQQRIDQLKGSVQSTTQQKLELDNFDASKYNVESNEEKIASLQSDQLKNCSETKLSLNQKKDEIDLKIKSAKAEAKNLEVRAPATGIVHVLNPDQQTKLVGTGTALAQIYPALNSKQKIKLRSYIAPSDISSVKKGQKLRLKIVRNVPTPIIVEGEIKKISIAPVIMNKANYYVVEAFAKVDQNQVGKLHYGMTGQGSVITGKESFFTYYKNRLFNKGLDD